MERRLQTGTRQRRDGGEIFITSAGHDAVRCMDVSGCNHRVARA